MKETPTQSVVTPGNHDGIHLGHRALVTAAREIAGANGWRTLAMCFDPHPTRILAPQRAPVLLTDMQRRVEILKGAGCDDVAVFPFDDEFARTAPHVFVEDILVAVCGARAVVVGPDFQFGHKRSGNIDTLRQLGQKHGFSVTVVEPVMLDEEAVSSTRVRRVLREDGDVALVAKMLTRVHESAGLVVEGDKRGTTIGFPTANLQPDALQLPADGVYAIVARVLDETPTDEPRVPPIAGVANLGVRPTFAAGRSIEAHLFDFNQDLYGKRLRIGYVQRIRGERRFDGVESLKAQIAEDCVVAQKAIATADTDLLRWM